MALALYKVVTPYAISVSTNDLSGTRPSSVTFSQGDVFIGDNTDSAIDILVANNEVVLVAVDYSDFLSGQLGLKVGMDSTEIVGPAIIWWND